MLELLERWDRSDAGSLYAAWWTRDSCKDFHDFMILRVEEIFRIGKENPPSLKIFNEVGPAWHASSAGWVWATLKPSLRPVLPLLLPQPTRFGCG